MKKLILKYQNPFSYNGNITFYDAGENFFLVDKKEMFFDKECNEGYVVAYRGFLPFDGLYRADMFEIIEE